MTDQEHRDVDDRDLDTLLSESAPATSEHGPVRTAALEAMARDARPSRGRRVRRPLWVGAGAIALVLAGGMAASAAFDWHSWWAHDAAAEYTYTLPSGAECSEISGNVRGPADAVAAANEFLGRSDLLDVIDVEAAVANVRSDEHTYQRNDGEVVDAGPGTEYWTADFEYEHALDLAVSTALWDTLRAQGFAPEGMSYQGELNCPDADLPDWMDQAGG